MNIFTPMASLITEEALVYTIMNFFKPGIIGLILGMTIIVGIIIYFAYRK